MKNLFILLVLTFMVSCCAAPTNPDDNIDGYESNKEVVKKPRMATVTLFYEDGTSKVIKHEWSNTYNTDCYVKFVSDDNVFIHYGTYDITYDKY